jgi:large subunit ribosomal protein L51
MYKGGLLPRPDPKIDDESLPIPQFKNIDRWTLKKSTFGQNDYIDILGLIFFKFYFLRIQIIFILMLGDGSVHPVDLIRGPSWLIGFKGNELQRLSRQLKFVGKEIKAKDPNKFHEINKRIKYLMWRYNHKFGMNYTVFYKITYMFNILIIMKIFNIY